MLALLRWNSGPVEFEAEEWSVLGPVALSRCWSKTPGNEHEQQTDSPCI